MRERERMREREKEKMKEREREGKGEGEAEGEGEAKGEGEAEGEEEEDGDGEGEAEGEAEAKGEGEAEGEAEYPNLVESKNLYISAVANCTIEEHNGFLKNVCGEELKCVYSDEYYPTGYKFSVGSFVPCSDDPHFYQACGASKRFRSKILNGRLLCESFICEIERGSAELITAYD